MKKLRPEGIILLLGFSGFVVLTLLALVPSKGDKDYSFRAVQGEAVNAQQNGAGFKPVSPPIAIAQGQNVVLQPLVERPVIPYHGTIQRVLNRDPGGWGQIHIFVGDGTATPQEISLAPEWYLQFQGCSVALGDPVYGEAYSFAQPGTAHATNEQLYAKNMVINGMNCSLRTAQGFALWSDQLR
ncbi:MAG: hypothetical protein HQL49_06770 [Gammaproteobacteria bacterium]|nr:hypothetical protein [Gammaproteobacteria bacterium]